MISQLSQQLDSHASRTQRRVMLSLVVLSTLLAAALAPFSRFPLVDSPAFLPSYLTALLFTKGLTCYLLFLHYFSVRRLSLGLLAAVYLFISCRVFAGWYYVEDPAFDLHGFWGLWHSYTDPGVMLAMLCYRREAGKTMSARAVRQSLWLLLPLPPLLVVLATYRIVHGHAQLLLYLSHTLRLSSAHLYLLALLGSLLVLFIIWWTTRLRNVLHLWLSFVSYLGLINLVFMLLSQADRATFGWHVAMLASLLSSVGLAFVLLRELQHLYHSVQFANHTLWIKSMHDELTGLYNRRYLDEQLAINLQHQHDRGASLAMILIDVDHFKLINDRYGHVEGDGCLVQIARILRQSTYLSAHFIARYGGEEFAVVLPGASLDAAVSVVHGSKIRDGLSVSISAGVAWWQPGPGPVPVPVAEAGAALMRQADAALYVAKRNGRNQVRAYSQSECEVVPQGKEM